MHIELANLQSLFSGSTLLEDILPIPSCRARADASLALLQGAGCHADAHTYASLIDACARACRCDLAVQAYKKALRDGFLGCVIIYTSVIAACGAVRPVELSTALSVYEDMQRCSFPVTCVAVTRSWSRLMWHENCNS